MICPFDGRMCPGHCAYPCPGIRRAAIGYALDRALLVGAVAVVVIALIWVFAQRAHGAEAGLWPPDDRPRAQYAFLMRIVTGCHITEANVDRRGTQWLKITCDF